MGLWASILFRPTMTHPDERAASMLDGHLAKDVWDPQNGTDGPVPMLERPRLVLDPWLSPKTTC